MVFFRRVFIQLDAQPGAVGDRGEAVFNLDWGHHEIVLAQEAEYVAGQGAVGGRRAGVSNRCIVSVKPGASTQGGGAVS